MEISITPFKAEDAVELLGRDCERYFDLLIKLEMDGPGWTGRLEDGRVLGCAGMQQVAPWVADFWVIPSRFVAKYPIAFHKTIVTKFRELVASSNAWRIQAVVDPNYPERVRWITRLGFQREGTMRCFGPDRQDMDLYSIIRSNGDGRT